MDPPSSGYVQFRMREHSRGLDGLGLGRHVTPAILGSLSREGGPS